MSNAALFWWLVNAACLLWFSTITVYVAIRGGLDIRHMLDRLKQLHAEEKRSDE